MFLRCSRVSCTTLVSGARQLVVQDALETTVSEVLYSVWFTPITYLRQIPNVQSVWRKRHSRDAAHQEGAAKAQIKTKADSQTCAISSQIGFQASESFHPLVASHPNSVWHELLLTEEAVKVAAFATKPAGLDHRGYYGNQRTPTPHELTGRWASRRLPRKPWARPLAFFCTGNKQCNSCPSN